MIHNQDAPTPELTCEKQDRLAIVTLDNPAKRNALSHAMRHKLITQYREWVDNADIYAIIIESSQPSFFCAGSDIVEIYEAHQRAPEEAVALLKNEYETIWAIDCYTKPVVSMINGRVMGGGVGLSQHGTHIIAGENFSWSMPECKIGLFPDVGITRLLANMPGAIGIYLGLTGRAINRDDASYLGLIEHRIDAAQFEPIKTALREAEPIDTLLDNLNQPAGESKLAAMEPVISRVFSNGTVEAIIKALEEVAPEHEQWASGVLEDLGAASPTSLKVTLEAILRAKSFQLEHALAQDFTLIHHFLNGHDFLHAIKARMIDKTAPAWQPASLEEVTNDTVARYFTDPGSEKLDLPPRELGVDK